MQVDPSITKPYARLSLEIKQQFDSWKIITEADPFAIAEMFGNIGGFWGEWERLNTRSRSYRGSNVAASASREDGRTPTQCDSRFLSILNRRDVALSPRTFSLLSNIVLWSLQHPVRCHLDITLQIFFSCCGPYSSSRPPSKTPSSRPAPSRSRWSGVPSGRRASPKSSRVRGRCDAQASQRWAKGAAVRTWKKGEKNGNRGTDPLTTDRYALERVGRLVLRDGVISPSRWVDAVGRHLAEGTMMMTDETPTLISMVTAIYLPRTPRTPVASSIPSMFLEPSGSIGTLLMSSPPSLPPSLLIDGPKNRPRDYINLFSPSERRFNKSQPQLWSFAARRVGDNNGPLTGTIVGQTDPAFTCLCGTRDRDHRRLLNLGTI